MTRLIFLLLLSSSSAWAVPVIVMQKVGDGTVTTLPGNGMHCATGCSVTAKQYAVGTPLAFLAEAGEGYQFDHWEGACSGAATTPICAFTVSMNHTAKAVFTKRTTLPACPALGTSVPVFTNFPINPANVTGAGPVGGVDSDSHIFPNWHMFAAAAPTPLPMFAEPVYTPSAIDLLHVMRIWKGGEWDYYLRMANCDGVEILVAIVNDFSPYLLALLGSPDASYMGQIEIWDQINFSLPNNFFLGTVRKSDRKLALEVYDRRRPAASFTTLGRYRAAHAYIQCPLDYFVSGSLGVSTPLTALTGSACGRVDQDIAGTLHGNWFLSSEPWGTDQTMHISFTTNNSGIPYITIGKNSALRTAVGTPPDSVYNVNGQTAFTTVTSASGLKCYSLPNSKTLLVHMTAAASVKVKVSTTACNLLGGYTIDTAPSSMPAPLVFVR